MVKISFVLSDVDVIGLTVTVYILLSWASSLTVKLDESNLYILKSFMLSAVSYLNSVDVEISKSILSCKKRFDLYDGGIKYLKVFFLVRNALIYMMEE